jgi:hypothetical protein
MGKRPDERIKGFSGVSKDNPRMETTRSGTDAGRPPEQTLSCR